MGSSGRDFFSHILQLTCNNGLPLVSWDGVNHCLFVPPHFTNRPMRGLSRQLLSALLLAIYGSISLMGYGLHELASHSHHDGGMMVTECRHHCHHEHEHEDDAATSIAGPVFRTGGCPGESHVCDVCLLLEQMRSEWPQVQAAVLCQHVVAIVAAAAPRIDSQTTPGLHSARGPPAILR